MSQILGLEGGDPTLLSSSSFLLVHTSFTLGKFQFHSSSFYEKAPSLLPVLRTGLAILDIMSFLNLNYFPLQPQQKLLIPIEEEI